LTLSAVDRLAGTPLFDALGARLLGGPAVSDPFELMGLRFPNRVGLAAGLDKDARHIDGLALLGFGFLELGTVTPLAPARKPEAATLPVACCGRADQPLRLQQPGIERFVDSVRRSRTWQRTPRADVLKADHGRRPTGSVPCVGSCVLERRPRATTGRSSA
jgi:dihydroorotate dehydrogenase